MPEKKEVIEVLRERQALESKDFKQYKYQIKQIKGTGAEVKYIRSNVSQARIQKKSQLEKLQKSWDLSSQEYEALARLNKEFEILNQTNYKSCLGVQFFSSNKPSDSSIVTARRMRASHRYNNLLLRMRKKNSMHKLGYLISLFVLDKSMNSLRDEYKRSYRSIKSDILHALDDVVKVYFI